MRTIRRGVAIGMWAMASHALLSAVTWVCVSRILFEGGVELPLPWPWPVVAFPVISTLTVMRVIGSVEWVELLLLILVNSSVVGAAIWLLRSLCQPTAGSWVRYE